METTNFFSFIVRNWSRDMRLKKCGTLKICVKNTDFHVSTTADYMMHASAMLLNTCNTKSK
jgi:hypothetical protein